MTLIRTLAAAAWLMGAAAVPVWAQDGAPDDEQADDETRAPPELKPGALRIDLNAPTAAAAAIIGSDDIAMTSVRTASDFSTQLMSGFDDNGVLQAGVAFSGQPYYWLGVYETREQYVEDKSFFSFLKRTQFSMATKQIDGDNGANGVGVGVALSWQLFENHDIVRADAGYECLQRGLASNLDLLTDIQNAAEVKALGELKARHPATYGAINPARGDTVLVSQPQAVSMGVPARHFGPGSPTEMPLATVIRLIGHAAEYEELRTTEETNTASERIFDIDRKACDVKVEDYLKSQDSLVLTVAQGLKSPDGKYNNLESDRRAIYLQFRSGSENPVAKFLGVPLIGLVSHVTDETVKIDDTTEDIADRTIIGFGSANEGEDHALDFQVSYAQSDFQSARPDAEEFKYTVAYSRRLSEGIWLEFKAGSKSSDDVADDSFVGLSLKLSPTFIRD